MPASTQYLLPDGVGLAAAQAALAKHFRLEPGRARSVDRTFYDTFDGRLHGDGLLLTLDDGWLRLIDGPREIELAAVSVSGRPQRLLVPDLPAGRLRELAAPVIEMRAVTPVIRIHSRLLPLRALDGDAKTVVRLVFEEPSLVTAAGKRSLQPRLHVTGVRGYDRALEKAQQALEGLGLPTARLALHDEAVTVAGGAPGGVSSGLDIALRPGQRADSGATVLLQRLLGAIEQNVPGTLADVDSEFLHDLRVAVRRTRSAQRQLAKVFPPEQLARFRGEFRWLQQVTGPTRDLDVYLLELDELSAGLPAAVRPDLEPLRALLAEQRRREQKRMVRALRSPRTAAILGDWARLLDGLVDEPPEDRPDAARPIGAVAGQRIGSVYRRMVRDGDAIDDSSPHEDLHDLRKTGKELRYLLEFFAVLFPGKVVKPMVKTLKALQDTLGRFQDREIQAALLRSLSDEVARLDRGPAALMAMGLLVDRLEADQAAARAEFAERFAAFAARPQRLLVKETFG